MSAFGLGREAGGASFRNERDAGEFVGRVVRWVPGDVIVLFAACITWVGVDKPSVPLLVLFGALTPLIVLGGAWSRSRHRVGKSDYVKAVLGLVAFVIWSLTVPGSGWRAWPVIAENVGWVAVISAVGGVLFGLIGSGVELRMSADEQLAA